jgi:hypothetical protein
MDLQLTPNATNKHNKKQPLPVQQRYFFHIAFANLIPCGFSYSSFFLSLLVLFFPFPIPPYSTTILFPHTPFSNRQTDNFIPISTQFSLPPSKPFIFKSSHSKNTSPQIKAKIEKKRIVEAKATPDSVQNRVSPNHNYNEIHNPFYDSDILSGTMEGVAREQPIK